MDTFVLILLIFAVFLSVAYITLNKLFAVFLYIISCITSNVFRFILYYSFVHAVPLAAS